MKRRFLAGAAAAATALALVPAAPALASGSASANLAASDKAVFPGAEQFSIVVKSNEAPGVFGVGSGKTINAIRVNFPVSEAGVKLAEGVGTAAGCTSAAGTNLGTTQFITYRGCSLAPGASTTVTFPATVDAPLARDLRGDFRVQVSSDNFQTASSAAGDLITEVNVLQVLGFTPVAPTNADGSKGVTDGTATVGQTVTYATQVKNHSRSALTVTAGTASSVLGDSGGSGSGSIPAGGTGTVSAPLTLGEAAGPRTVTGTATAPNADAPAVENTLTGQARAVLTPTSLDGERTASGPGSARDFVVRMDKTGDQSVDAVDTQLVFGSNTCDVVGDPTYAAGSGSQQLTYRCLNVSGTDGIFPASIRYSLTDSNLASYGRTVGVGNIIIDNLAPILQLNVVLPEDADDAQQTAVKNGDTISVSGTITNAADLAGNTVRVTLQPDAGPAQVIDAAVSGSGAERTFSGSKAASWEAAATGFTSRAEVADTAGNTGGTQAPGRVLIDNALPVLNNPGVVINATTVEVTFSDATAVLGGCDERMWLVDGRPGRVSDVVAGDSADCASTGSKTRRLTLSSALGADDTPTITYDPAAKRTLLGQLPAKDGAGNDALRKVIDTVTIIKPLAPSIIELERRDGSSTAAFEPAYFDTSELRYYTNVGGAEALQLTVDGIRDNYSVQVLRGGAIVAERSFPAAGGLVASNESREGSVLVPMPTTDGAYTFSVRLVSAAGNIGDATAFSVVLDRVTPKLGAASLSGSTVTSTFTEKVVAGSDFADNWFVSETVATETGTAQRRVGVDSVVAEGLTVRKMEVTQLLDPSRFTGVDYFVQTGDRYEDRAGNFLADTLP